MEISDLPDYSEFFGSNESIPTIVGMDHALWSIANLYEQLKERPHSNRRHDDALSYWIDCINRSNRFWSTAISIMSRSPVEALSLIRSSLEASLGLSVPYHIPEERFRSGSFTWMMMQFETNKIDTFISQEWAREFNQETPKLDKALLRHLIIFLHKSTHCIPSKNDEGDTVWSEHVSLDAMQNYLNEESSLSRWVMIFGGLRLDILRYSLSNMFEYLNRVLLESFSGETEEQFVEWIGDIIPFFAKSMPYDMEWMNPVNQVRIRILDWVWPTAD